MEQTVTSVRVDIEDAQWLRVNGITWRAAIKAGVRALKDGPMIDALRARIREFEIEAGRNAMRKDMIYWIFQKHPEVYELARKAYFASQESDGDSNVVQQSR